MSSTASKPQCPCGNDKPYRECCGAIIDGSAIAETPESLMRARYTAYASGQFEFILKTMSKRLQKDFSRPSFQEFVDNARFISLQVLSAPKPRETDREGTVEFAATYLQDDREHLMHEKSQFVRKGKSWIYTGEAQ